MSNFWFYPYILIFVLIIIDYVTGIIGAMVSGQFSSSKMRMGLVHKMMYLVVIVVAFVIEELAVYFNLGFVNGIVALVCVWIIITEIGSILENLVVINPKFADSSFMHIFDKREVNNDLYKAFEDKALTINESEVE